MGNLSTIPSGKKNELFSIEGWSFYGETKYYSPESALIVKKSISDVKEYYSEFWTRFLPSVKIALVVHIILHYNLKNNDWDEVTLQAARLVEYDCHTTDIDYLT